MIGTAILDDGPLLPLNVAPCAAAQYGQSWHLTDIGGHLANVCCWTCFGRGVDAATDVTFPVTES